MPVYKYLKKISIDQVYHAIYISQLIINIITIYKL